MPVCHLFVASHLTGLRTSWIIPSHPAVSATFSAFDAAVVCVFSPPGGSPFLPSSVRYQAGFNFRASSDSFCLFSVLSLQSTDSLGCSDPPDCCLCWPTQTPCSFFLRTRKRLALLTPSRGLALATLEKRPLGWAGHRGREEGGPALAR